MGSRLSYNARIRRRRRRHPALAAAGFIAAALAVSAAEHLAVLILLTVAGAGGYVLIRNRRASTRPAGRRGQAPDARPAPASSTSTSTSSSSTSKLDARARRNGWAPPANPELVTIAVSPACQILDCVACPGGSCNCPACQHQPARAVAVSNALYDAAQAEGSP